MISQILKEVKRPDQRHPQHQRSYHTGPESPYFEILPTLAYKIKFSKTDILLLQQVKVPMWAVGKQYYEMSKLVGFQTMVILDPNGMTFDAIGVFGMVFWLLFKSGLSCLRH